MATGKPASHHTSGVSEKMPVINQRTEFTRYRQSGNQRPRPVCLRALADQHVSRRGAGHGADRTGGLRRRDRWRELPRLHRPDPGADPAARRHRHGRHSRGPQGRRHPTRHPGRRGHPLVLATLQARTSIPSSSASRSSRPSFAPLAVAAPRRSGRSSASAWRTSALTNAATMFGTAGTRPPHGHEKRFSLRLGLIGRWVQMTRSEERRSIAPLRPPFRGPPPAHELPAGSVGRNGSVQRYTRRSDGRRTRWCRGAESNCRHHDFQTCAEADQNRSDRVFTC